MHTQHPDTLAEATIRIWSQTRANLSRLDATFERIIQSFYSKVVRPGDVVIDGGAHTGRHAVPLARLVGDAGRVVAFEPLPMAAAQLAEVLEATGLASRVRIRPEALGPERGRHEFFVVNNMLEFSGLTKRSYVDFVANETRIEVQVETLDHAMTDPGGPVTFIKLDLEGGEFRALQGAERLLTEGAPCCVFENGLGVSAGGYDADEFFGFFHRVGYVLHDIFGCPLPERLWKFEGPLNFVAVPAVRAGELVPLLCASALEEILSLSAPPVEQLGPPPARFVSKTAGPIKGCVDRFEITTRVGGWAAEDARDRPPRSLAVTVDGKPVGTIQPCEPRCDVLAATGRTGLVESGFAFVLPTRFGERIEVHAEAPDGTFVRLEKVPSL
jgi:FkbM family methyltransferase